MALPTGEGRDSTGRCLHREGTSHTQSRSSPEHSDLPPLNTLLTQTPPVSSKGRHRLPVTVPAVPSKAWLLQAPGPCSLLSPGGSRHGGRRHPVEAPQRWRQRPVSAGHAWGQGRCVPEGHRPGLVSATSPAGALPPTAPQLLPQGQEPPQQPPFPHSALARDSSPSGRLTQCSLLHTMAELQGKKSSAFRRGPFPCALGYHLKGQHSCSSRSFTWHRSRESWGPQVPIRERGDNFPDCPSF